MLELRAGELGYWGELGQWKNGAATLEARWVSCSDKVVGSEEQPSQGGSAPLPPPPQALQLALPERSGFWISFLLLTPLF